MKRGIIQKILFVFIILVLILFILRTPVQETRGGGILSNLNSVFSLSRLTDLIVTKTITDYGMCESDADCTSHSLCYFCNLDTSTCEYLAEGTSVTPKGFKEGDCKCSAGAEICLPSLTEPFEPPTITLYQTTNSIYTCQNNNIVTQTTTCNENDCETKISEPIYSCGSCATCDTQALLAYTPPIQTEQAFTSESPAKFSELFPGVGTILGFLDQLSKPALGKLLPTSSLFGALTQAGSLSVMQLANTQTDPFATGAHFVVFSDPPNCAPCRQLEEKITSLQNENKNIYNINILKPRGYLWNKYVGAEGRIPTSLVIIEGKIVDGAVGDLSLNRLKQMADRVRDYKPVKPLKPIEQPKPPIQPPTPQPQDQCSKPEDEGKKCDCPPEVTGTSQQYISSDGKTNPREITDATVNLRIEDPDGNSVGSGTVIDSRGGMALIATCGHVFRDSKGQGLIEVNLQGINAGNNPIQGTLKSYDLEKDVGLVIITLPPEVSITPARLPPENYQAKVGDLVYTAGCSGGDPCTVQNQKINSLDKYLGPPNIQVSGLPVEGRSGGGLFSKEGYFIGVCMASNPPANEGLFSSYETVISELDKNNLQFVHNPTEIQPFETIKQCHCKNKKCVEKTEEPPKPEPISPPKPSTSICKYTISIPIKNTHDKLITVKFSPVSNKDIAIESIDPYTITVNPGETGYITFDAVPLTNSLTTLKYEWEITPDISLTLRRSSSIPGQKSLLKMKDNPKVECGESTPPTEPTPLPTTPLPPISPLTPLPPGTIDIMDLPEVGCVPKTPEEAPEECPLVKIKPVCPTPEPPTRESKTKCQQEVKKIKEKCGTPEQPLDSGGNPIPCGVESPRFKITQTIDLRTGKPITYELAKDITCSLEYNFCKGILEWSNFELESADTNGVKTPVTIIIDPSLERGGGKTWIPLVLGNPSGAKMKLHAKNKNTLLHSIIPHEINHLVTTTLFDKEDVAGFSIAIHEGIATASEDNSLKCFYFKNFIKAATSNPPYSFRTEDLLSMKDYPKDPYEDSRIIRDFYGQSNLLTEFLLKKGGGDCTAKKKLMNTVRQAVRNGWNKALQDNYGFKNIQDLHNQWVADLESQLGPDNNLGYEDRIKNGCNPCTQ